MKQISTQLEAFTNATTRLVIPLEEFGCLTPVILRFRVCGTLYEVVMSDGEGFLSLGNVPLRLTQIEYQLLKDGSIVAWGLINVKQNEGTGDAEPLIPDGSIGAQQLADGAVTFEKLAQDVSDEIALAKTLPLPTPPQDLSAFIKSKPTPTSEVEVLWEGECLVYKLSGVTTVKICSGEVVFYGNRALQVYGYRASPTSPLVTWPTLSGTEPSQFATKADIEAAFTSRGL